MLTAKQTFEALARFDLILLGCQIQWRQSLHAVTLFAAWRRVQHSCGAEESLWAVWQVVCNQSRCILPPFDATPRMSALILYISTLLCHWQRSQHILATVLNVSIVV